MGKPVNNNNNNNNAPEVTPEVTPETVATATNVGKGINFNLREYENDVAASAGLRQLAAAAYMVWEFLEEAPEGVDTKEVARALLALVPKGKREAARTAAHAAARYVN